MPKKETGSRVPKIAGKGLAGGKLTKKDQAVVNTSATSQDETPKKAEKKKKINNKIEKNKKK